MRGIGAEGNPQLEIERAPLHLSSHRLHSPVLLDQVIEPVEVKVLLSQNGGPVQRSAWEREGERERERERERGVDNCTE